MNTLNWPAILIILGVILVMSVYFFRKQGHDTQFGVAVFWVGVAVIIFGGVWP